MRSVMLGRLQNLERPQRPQPVEEIPGDEIGARLPTGDRDERHFRAATPAQPGDCPAVLIIRVGDDVHHPDIGLEPSESLEQTGGATIRQNRIFTESSNRNEQERETEPSGNHTRIVVTGTRAVSHPSSAHRRRAGRRVRSSGPPDAGKPSAG